LATCHPVVPRGRSTESLWGGQFWPPPRFYATQAGCKAGCRLERRPTRASVPFSGSREATDKGDDSAPMRTPPLTRTRTRASYLGWNVKLVSPISSSP
jgi:hypothetical protein